MVFANSCRHPDRISSIIKIAASDGKNKRDRRLSKDRRQSKTRKQIGNTLWAWNEGEEWNIVKDCQQKVWLNEADGTGKVSSETGNVPDFLYHGITLEVVFQRWLEGDWPSIFEVIGGLLVVIGGYWRWSGQLSTIGIVVFCTFCNLEKLRGA